MVPAPPGSPPPLLPVSSLSPWLAHLPLPNQSVRFPRPCPVGPFSWTAFSLRSVSAMLSVTIPTLVTPTLCLYSKLFSICCHAGSSACPDSTPHSLVLFQCSCEKHHYLLRVRAKNLGVLLIICLPLTLLPISKPLQGLAVLMPKRLWNLTPPSHFTAATSSQATSMACLDASVGLLPSLPASLLVPRQPKPHDRPKDKDQSGFSREIEPTGYIDDR